MGLLDALKQTPSTADAMQQPKRKNCRAVVVGAGPAGLLAAINLLRRSSDEVEYHVTLVETGEDYGVLDAAGLEKKRSWMIGLSTHGLTALRAVPGLYEDYVSQVEASPAAAHSPPPPSPLFAPAKGWRAHRVHRNLPRQDDDRGRRRGRRRELRPSSDSQPSRIRPAPWSRRGAVPVGDRFALH